jgi:hypothetical protein
MQYISINLKILALASLTILLCGFTDFSERVPAPKDVPKRTEDKNAGIVIPAFDASPYDVIEKSYDHLEAFMLYPEKGIFMSLSTSNYDFNAHKLTFAHKKLGFVTQNAYRITIAFIGNKAKPQKISHFVFSPFAPTESITQNKIIPIAESWVKFFDSQGWKRIKENPNYPYKRFPKQNSAPYMRWESDGFELKLAIRFNEFVSLEKNEPRYYLSIVFDPDPDSWKRK